MHGLSQDTHRKGKFVSALVHRTEAFTFYRTRSALPATSPTEVQPLPFREPVRHGLQTPAADLKTTFLTPSSPSESWGTTRSILRTAPGSPLPYVSERGTLAKESPSFRDGPYFERATLQERLPPDQRLSPESPVQSVAAPTEPPPRDVLPISAPLPRLHRMQYRSLPSFLQRYPLQS